MKAQDLALLVLQRVEVPRYEDLLSIANKLFKLSDKEYFACEAALSDADLYFNGLVSREDQAKIIVEVLDEQEYFGDVGKPFHVSNFVPGQHS